MWQPQLAEVLSDSSEPATYEGEVLSVGPHWPTVIATAALNGLFTAAFLVVAWLVLR